MLLKLPSLYYSNIANGLSKNFIVFMSVQKYTPSKGGGGGGGWVPKCLISLYFQNKIVLSYFSINFLAIFCFENFLMCTLFERRRWPEKVYILYISVNADFFG